MAELSSRELRAIIRRDLPGYRLAETHMDAAAPRLQTPADAQTPDLETLRRKWPPNVPVVAESDATEAAAEDQVMITVEPDSRDALDRGARPKAVIVSVRDRRIIASQG